MRHYAAKWADISECGRYRYGLGRVMNAYAHLHWPRALLWVMLNPSTADADEDDATIRRVADFTEAWGFSSFMVGNLYALRATDPDELMQAGDIIGPRNDGAIYQMAKDSAGVVFAFGSSVPCKYAGAMRARSVQDAIRAAGHRPRSLGVTKDGWPRHPLYMPKSATLEAWSADLLR